MTSWATKEQLESKCIPAQPTAIKSEELGKLKDMRKRTSPSKSDWMRLSDTPSGSAAKNKKLGEHDFDLMQTDLSVVFPNNDKFDPPLIDSTSIPLPGSWIWTNDLLSDSGPLQHE